MEVCSLRDAAKPLTKLGVQVYGISLDDVASQAVFHKSEKLNYPLLSDPDGSVAAKYKVLMANRPYARRVTFVIDPKGVIRHVEDRVDVRSHGEQVAEVIRGLQKKVGGKKK